MLLGVGFEVRVCALSSKLSSERGCSVGCTTLVPRHACGNFGSILFRLSVVLMVCGMWEKDSVAHYLLLGLVFRVSLSRVE